MTYVKSIEKTIVLKPNVGDNWKTGEITANKNESKIEDQFNTVVTKEPDYINILLLAENAFPKSNFINAFANYSTLNPDFKKAQEEKQLLILCPSEVKVNDADGKRHNIIIGANEDSENFKQDICTYVFPLRLNGKVIRLIDTPSMGGSRQREKDDKKCENILNYIGNLYDLHGICFLVTFSQDTSYFLKYSINKLFSQLGKSALNNIIFITPGKHKYALTKLINMFGKTKGTFDVPLKGNIFHIDDKIFKYLIARNNSLNILPQKKLTQRWTKTLSECQR